MPGVRNALAGLFSFLIEPVPDLMAAGSHHYVAVVVVASSRHCSAATLPLRALRGI